MDTHDRSTDVQITIVGLSDKLCLDSLKLFSGLFCGLALFSLNYEVNDNGTLVNSHCLDSIGRNTERSCQSINEPGCATVGVELAERPVHSDFGHDSVLWFDFDQAARRDVKLEEILDADEAILTAALCLCQGCVASELLIPRRIAQFFAIGVDLDRTSDWVWNLNEDATSIGMQVGSHLLGWRATEMQLIVLSSEQLDRESGHAPLTCVERVPNVVHHRVDRVVEAHLLVQDENRLNGSVPSILVQVLNLEETDVASLADVRLRVWLVLAVRVSATYGLIVGHYDKVLGI